MEDNLKLKPCPWCVGTIVRDWYLDLGGWVVSCKGCLAKGPWKPTKKAAMNAWNIRDTDNL